MTIDGASGHPAYGGFSAPEPPPQPRAYERLEIPQPQPRMYEPNEIRRQAPGRRRMGVVLAGVLAALGLGVGFGVFSRVDLRPAPEPPPPPDVSALTDTPAAPAPAAGAGLVTPEEVARIALGEGEAPKPAKAAPPAPAAPAAVTVHSPPRAAATPALRVAVAPVRPAAPPVRAIAPAPPPRRLAAVAPTPQPVAPIAREAPAPVNAQRGFRPAFHCDWRLRPSEAMVCADPQLSAYDRELNRAFRMAVEAGAPRAWLREEQDEWVMVDRERAARRGGPDAVAEAYRRRIAELRSLYD